MAVNGIKIDVQTSAGTMEALHEAINARSKALGKTTEDSTVAAAITILRSLKASTKKAPVKAPEGSYRITLVAQGGAQIRGNPRRWRPVVNGKWDRSIRPVNLMYGLTPPGNLYKIELTNAALLPRKGLNAPVYYVMAPTEAVATSYAKARVERALRKESGMARVALAMAQAKASTKSRVVTKQEFANKGTMSTRASGIAYDAGRLTVSASGFSNGSVGVSFYDDLRYSSPAAGGVSALDSAMAKAVNSLFGAYGSAEMKAELESLKRTNPEAKFIDVFKRNFK